MATAAENSKDGIAAEPFEGALGKAAVCLHVSDLGFCGAAPSVIEMLSDNGSPYIAKDTQIFAASWA